MHAQAVGQIGRELEGKKCVIQIQMGPDVLPQRRVGGQLEQAAMVLRQLELAGRTQHAVTFDAAQLADLDLKRLAVLARR